MDTLSSNTPRSNPQKKRSKAKVSLSCAYCHKLYSVRESYSIRSKTNYCSRECLNADRRGETKQCIVCGKDMYVIRCQLATKKCCSATCRARYSMQEKTGKIYTDVTIKCLKCGKIFEALNTSKRKFCSQGCAYAYRIGPNMHNYKGNKIDCICLFCNAPFQTPESWIKKGEGKFCSASCRSRHTIEKQGGMVSSIEIAVKEVLEQLGETYFHQHRIGRFLVDFFLPNRNLVIEADGDYWHSLEKNKRNDLKKNLYMQEAGISLARLKESDIRLFCHDLVLATLAQHPILEERTR